ncbi:MAG: lecithin retinol acyltransferase family protein [Elainellaceae cyanobacterium]
MARGDQIYVIRPFVGLASVYEHHGIDCGDGTVIHYSKLEPTATVRRTARSQFSQMRSIQVKRYASSYIPEDVVRRAESRLGETQYSLLTNNCEHFATWCKVGVSESRQLSRFGVSPTQMLPRDLSQLLLGQMVPGQRDDVSSLRRHAFDNIAIAQSSIQTQIDHHTRELNSWQQIARQSLQRGREDLARGALVRKHPHQQKLDELTQQLQQLRDLRNTLDQQNVGI